MTNNSLKYKAATQLVNIQFWKIPHNITIKNDSFTTLLNVITGVGWS